MPLVEEEEKPVRICGQEVSKEALVEKLFTFTAVVTQILFQNHVFICPPHNHREYGYIILLSPIVPLYLISLMLKSNFSRLISKGFHRRSCCTITNKRNVLKIVYYTLLCTISPLAWVVLCFLRKHIYVCAMVGPTMYNTTASVQLRLNDHRAQSMKIGLILLQVLGLVVISVVVLKKCFINKIIKRKSEQNEEESLWKSYKEYQHECVQRFFHQNAMKQIESITENQVKSIFKISLRENKNENKNNDDKAESLDELIILELEEKWKRLKAIYPAIDSLGKIHEKVEEKNNTNEKAKLLTWSQSVCEESSI